ncbi:hypothetical protein [uncultured Methanobrevibacter sp.]|uniref:hypothetical protein n=1 Tax=uncultured Methanobrevibacter sp. TaxID=253161 RepID=UPI0025DF4404|nr:hypothetical protein [uncultured Methanobrevibacter sp.]
MVDYTTVRIKKDSLEKINKMKGENGSVADVIEKLLGSVEGCSIEDVVEVSRESVAITLEYTSFGRNTFNTKQEFGITFQQLKTGKVGDEFTANPNPEDEYYMNDTARILYVDDRSVLVRVTEYVKAEEGENSFVHIEHIDLF